jgi:c(7)-type cytochrome triheme protein
MLRSMSQGGLVLVLAVAVALAFVGHAQAQKVPADFSFDQGKDSPGKVTFSHEKHKPFADKCTVCHTKVFKMKKGGTGELTMAKMNAGEACGSCHNGKTESGGKVAFATNDKANCEKCHKK